MIGSTGVGQDRAGRAAWRGSPIRRFSRWKPASSTEVGYVGRDVESMIRDLVDIAIDNGEGKRLDEVADPPN